MQALRHRVGMTNFSIKNALPKKNCVMHVEYRLLCPFLVGTNDLIYPCVYFDCLNI